VSAARTDVGATHIALTAADLDASIAFYARYGATRVATL
jgi:catechol 2,3-dioxygenase-like lactoylglutathione lyase family enzyme